MSGPQVNKMVLHERLQAAPTRSLRRSGETELEPKPTKPSLTYHVQQPYITNSEDKGNGVVKDWHGRGTLDGHLGWGFHYTIRFQYTVRFHHSVRFHYTVRAGQPLPGYSSTLFPTGF